MISHTPCPFLCVSALELSSSVCVMSTLVTRFFVVTVGNSDGVRDVHGTRE